MLIRNSIIAGEILDFIESKSGFESTIAELAYYLERPIYAIQTGIERLVQEGLVVFDIDDQIVKIHTMEHYLFPIKVEKQIEFKELLHS